MEIKFEPSTDLKFVPGDYVPFKDREICERLRKISGKDLEKHPNPDFNIKVMMNPHPVLIATLFSRIKEASENNRKITLILGNPEPETYIPLAQLSIISKWTAEMCTYLRWTSGRTIRATLHLRPTRRDLHIPCSSTLCIRLTRSCVCRLKMCITPQQRT